MMCTSSQRYEHRHSDTNIVTAIQTLSQRYEHRYSDANIVTAMR